MDQWGLGCSVTRKRSSCRRLFMVVFTELEERRGWMEIRLCSSAQVSEQSAEEVDRNSYLWHTDTGDCSEGRRACEREREWHRYCYSLIHLERQSISALLRTKCFLLVEISSRNDSSSSSSSKGNPFFSRPSADRPLLVYMHAWVYSLSIASHLLSFPNEYLKCITSFLRVMTCKGESYFEIHSSIHLVLLCVSGIDTTEEKKQ